MRFSALALCLVAVSANNSSCGGDKPSKVVDCGHPDLGSCGNACCIADVTIPYPPAEVYNGTKLWLQGGGDDGSFTYVTGPGPGGQNPGDDLTPYGIPWQYVFQGTHKTTGGYVDTIDFNIKKDTAGTGSILRASTVSGIHGALGDNGQTYKTIAFIKSYLAPEKEAILTIVHGCGK